MKKYILALALLTPCFSWGAAYAHIQSTSLNKFQSFLWENNGFIDKVVPTEYGTVYVEFHTENATQPQLRAIVNLLSKI